MRFFLLVFTMLAHTHRCVSTAAVELSMSQAPALTRPGQMHRVTYGSKGERYEHLVIRIMAKNSEPAVTPRCQCWRCYSTDLNSFPCLIPVLEPQPHSWPLGRRNIAAGTKPPNFGQVQCTDMIGHLTLIRRCYWSSHSDNAMLLVLSL